MGDKPQGNGSSAAGVPLDGYVRVSRVGGRKGEGFISPDVQEQAILDWAKRNGRQHCAEARVERLRRHDGSPDLQRTDGTRALGQVAGIVVYRPTASPAAC